MAIQPAAWRCTACRRPSKKFSARDVRIVGMVASGVAAVSGVGFVGSLATSLAVPAVAAVMGWT